MSNNKQDHIVDSNKMVSSVEWLISQLQKSKDWHRVLNEISQMSSARVDIIEQAKAMHKEEIIKFAEDWGKSNLDCKEDLYNETFNNE